MINSVGVEALARRCYALELVFEDVWCENDRKVTKKSKAKLQLFDDYDITAIMKNGHRVPEADATVMKQLEFRAQTAKYLSKAPQGEGPQ